MKNNFLANINDFWEINILTYFQELSQNPIRLIPLVLDLTIVIFLIYKLLKATRNTRVWQLIKGIAWLIVLTAISGWLRLDILHYILTTVMTYGVIAMIVIFQPELRRGLEQLGTNKITKFFGVDKDLSTKTKEDIYKIAVAVNELAKTKTGALIVMERDIKIGDIAESGVIMDCEISPQLLVNIFVPKTPLHDGAVIIGNNKIKAAACILPLANDKQIAKALGTRHRAAIGISRETDSIAIVVSEETGKVSIAKDGTLIADVNDETLKKVLIKNIVTNRLTHTSNPNSRLKNMRSRLKANRKNKNQKTENNE